MLNLKFFSKGVLVFIVVLAFSAFVSAGVGIKWNEESRIVSEAEKKICMTYSVYNPWPEDEYVAIVLSESLQDVLRVQDKEGVLIPAQTSSSEAIPVEFCFDVPDKIYAKDCWLGNFFVCERLCNEEQKVYEGDVIAKSVPPPIGASGSGGSSAVMSVSAPLRLRVACNPMPRNYTYLYVLIAIVALIIVLVAMKYRKPKEQRYKEQLAALKAKIARTKK